MTPAPSQSQLMANVKSLAISAEPLALVTMRVENQLFGIPVEAVRDVLRGQKIARVPLASEEIAGSINLRGRIVTVVDVRKRLRFAPPPEGVRQTFVVVDHKHELYSFLVDSVGDVIDVPRAEVEKVPANLSGKWREVASGIWQMKEELLVVIDVSSMLRFNA